jgi:hypothetical protein
MSWIICLCDRSALQINRISLVKAVTQSPRNVIASSGPGATAGTGPFTDLALQIKCKQSLECSIAKCIFRTEYIGNLKRWSNSAMATENKKTRCDCLSEKTRRIATKRLGIITRNKSKKPGRACDLSISRPDLAIKWMKKLLSFSTIYELANALCVGHRMNYPPG